MSRRPVLRQMAMRMRRLLSTALLVALPVAPVLSLIPEAAQANVSAGDLVYLSTDGTTYSIIKRHVSGTTVTPTALYENPNIVSMDVSPDGSRIVFAAVAFTAAGTASDCTSSGFTDVLFIMNSDGTGVTALTGADFNDCSNTTRYNYQDYYPRWSPDGKWVLFTRLDQTTTSPSMWDIYKIPIDGSASASRLTTSGDAFSATWSPANSSGTYRIAFDLSVMSSSGHVYTMDADGSNQALVMSSYGTHNGLFVMKRGAVWC